MIEKVEIGETLPKESWLAAADALMIAAPYLANVFLSINHENRGKEDAEQFLAHMQLADIALRHVAEAAADKCRFIIVTEKEG